MADIYEIENGDAPKLLKVEPIDNFVCQHQNNRTVSDICFSGGMPFPSSPNIGFGLCLTLETTQQDAEVLADLINKHCPSPFAQIFERNLIEDDLLELNEPKWLRSKREKTTIAGSRRVRSG
jgi:hypothetical protein